MASSAHITLAEVRAQGLTVAQAPDAQVDAGIDLAVEYIQEDTGIRFDDGDYPAASPLLVDGRGVKTLHLPLSIISVSEVGVRTVSSTGTTYTEIESYRYEVYQSREVGNDDRQNPKLVRIDGGVWPEGTRNIYLVGHFGWTELADDPDNSGTDIERAPARIRRAEMILVINDFAWLLTEEEAQGDRLQRWIVDEKTDRHSYRLSDLAIGQGLTGITEVDKTLAYYKAKRPKYARA